MNVTVAELVATGNDRVLIDIRRVEEWQQTGVIAGAHRMTFFDAEGHADPAGWLADLAKIATPEDDLVLICRSSRRTQMILEFLHNQTEYTQARHLAGGMLGWLKSGFPVERVSD